MRSLLYRDPPVVPFTETPACHGGRQESVIVVKKGGKLLRIVARDRVIVEDPYLVMVRAVAFSIRENTPYAAQVTPRTVRDFLIKSNVGAI